jgi:glycine cleavage system H protein
VNGVSLPSELLYTKDHEWVAVSGNVARVGITDYAQDALGDIVFVQMPEVGSQVQASDSFSEIESTKSVNDVYAPVTGTVSAVNAALVDNPELLNSDPYGEGWICEITISGDLPADLMSAAQYGELIG